MLTDECRMKMKRTLKRKWDKRYFDQAWLSNAKWLRSENEPRNFMKKTNGARTLFQKIFTYHKKKGNYEEGQNVIKFLASQAPEVKEIEDEIGDTGCVEWVREKWGVEMDNIAISCEDGMYREVVICFKENDDEGCCTGEMNLLKEDERLEKIWKRRQD